MNNPTSDWPVLIQSSVAGFDSTRDKTIEQLMDRLHCSVSELFEE